jgi:Holliday junction resolvasome RuvABC endonuclease subunit
MGVAVLQGRDLIYYGVKTFKTYRPAEQLLTATREALLGIIRTYRPTMLAYEKTFYVQQETSMLLQLQQQEIRRLGHAAKLTVIGYSPAHVRQVLCRDGWATKRMVADLLVGRFPQLAGYRYRDEPTREHYWLNMFDALAVAVVAAEEADVMPAQPADKSRTA